MDLRLSSHVYWYRHKPIFKRLGSGKVLYKELIIVWRSIQRLLERTAILFLESIWKF